ncbi:MAG: NAD-binding protein [Verrucomicrobiota bacterium]|nr:NAD-binding protein [Verrucomicrobiota bacterium]
MAKLDRRMNMNTSVRAARIRKRLAALWPQFPLAIVLAFVGFLNVLDGLSVPVRPFEHVRALTGLAGSLSALGGTAQVILGVMLTLAGVGLLWRLVSAWTLSVFLLVVTVGVNAAQERWGLGLALQAVLLGALLWAKPHFKRHTFLASLLFSVSGILAVLAYGAIGSYLLRDDFQPPIPDWTTAFYYTVVTLSTVGYGDIVPHTDAARWFAMSLLVIGLGVFASAIASALGPKISGELQRMFNPKEKTVQPKEHVILVGEGAIARNTAKELKQRGVPFVQIVAAETEKAGDAEHQIVEGDATDDVILRQAGIQHARMVIAAREDDGDNAFIALVAKDLNPNVRLLAVASSALAIRRLKLARADLVFSPAAVGSRLLADLVEGNQISPAFQDLLEGGPHKT